MLGTLFNRYRGLIVYTGLNYLDKFLVLMAPLVILLVLKNKAVYNRIEYIYSIANIAIIFCETIKIYLFYGYKESENRNEYIELARKYFSFFQLCILILALLMTPVFFWVHPGFIGVFCYSFCRICYLSFINFHNGYFRLKDCASKIFAISIPVSLLTIILPLIVNIYKPGNVIFSYFLAQSALFLGAVVFFAFRQKISFIGFVNFFKKAVLFSWPIVLNALLIAMINNSGKIYAYQNLSQNDMFTLSFLLRIMMVIQLAHGSVLAYYSKAIYTDQNVHISRKILMIYTLSILGAIFLISILCLGIRMWIKISWSWAIPFLFFYMLFWCFQAFLETYYTKHNRNKNVLLFSAISCGLYFGLLLWGVPSLLYLSIYMFISTLINLGLLVIFYRKLFI